jgi:hypothetical protein
MLPSGYKRAMQFQNIIQAIACAALICFSAGCSKEAQAEAPQRTAGNVMNGMRLKSLTKELELTDEQKVKVQALLDEEAKESEKIYSDASFSATQKSIKVGELKRETYGKIKPLLTATQAQKLEEMLSRTGKRKRS